MNRFEPVFTSPVFIGFHWLSEIKNEKNPTDSLVLQQFSPVQFVVLTGSKDWTFKHYLKCWQVAHPLTYLWQSLEIKGSVRRSSPMDRTTTEKDLFVSNLF